MNSILNEYGVLGSLLIDPSLFPEAAELPDDIWTNFMLALMDETDSAFAREQKATNPRIQKYTAKYRR